MKIDTYLEGIRDGNYVFLSRFYPDASGLWARWQASGDTGIK